MSRKGRIEDSVKEGWATVKMTVLSVGLGKYKPDKSGRVKKAIVILHHDASKGNPAQYWAPVCQQYLINSTSEAVKAVVIVDVTPLFDADEDPEELLQREIPASWDKRVLKPLQKTLNRLLLDKATLVASGSFCQVALKILPMTHQSGGSQSQLSNENVARILLINPQLPASSVNTIFRGPFSRFASSTPLLITFLSQQERERRVAIIRAAFPVGFDLIGTEDVRECLLMASGACEKQEFEFTDDFDEELMTPMGETLWISKLTIEMSRQTKQYEHYVSDMTHELIDMINEEKRAEEARRLGLTGAFVSEKSSADVGIPEIGALVMRGNRCVLVRSLEGEWEGMRIPAVPAMDGEDPITTAQRSMEELCDIEPEETYALDIPPVVMYPKAPAHDNRGKITIYALYAVQPPPDGPLEDADIEDEEDYYDWYTWERAVEALSSNHDDAAVASLRTMACALQAAHDSGLDIVPNKWGGIFGQEMLKTGVGMTGADSADELEEKVIDAGSADDLEEFGINSYTFKSLRPLHPERLKRLEIALNNRLGSMSVNVGMKGIVWIASDMEKQKILSYENCEFDMSEGDTWWATTDESQWPEELKEALKPLWHDPYGDRQNEIIISGLDMDIEKVKKELQACVLTDEEYSLGSEAWTRYTDPYYAGPFCMPTAAMQPIHSYNFGS
jgi:hypothetical protein